MGNDLIYNRKLDTELKALSYTRQYSLFNQHCNDDESIALRVVKNMSHAAKLRKTED